MKKFILLLALALLPVLSYAQQPKMHLKLFGGTNAANFIYRLDSIQSDILAGGQLGLGFRVTRRKAFVEFDIYWANSGVTVAPTEAAQDGIDIDEPANVRLNAIVVPINVGYVPVKIPWFKWYLYGGVVNRFSIKGRLDVNGEKTKFSPKELGLPIYNLGVRFGTQIDLTIVNVDLNYTIGVTNAIRGNVRTNFHGLELSLGFAI